ncbi:MAG: hypothetical protein ABI688_07970 [Bacteroidota bacterium]
MYRYHVCRVERVNTQYQLHFIDKNFDNRESAAAFIRYADKHGHGWVWLTILEVYEP